MDEQAMELAMTIVAQAGDARSSCMEAIAFAKKDSLSRQSRHFSRRAAGCPLCMRSRRI